MCCGRIDTKDLLSLSGSPFRAVDLMDSCLQTYRFYFSESFSSGDCINQDISDFGVPRKKTSLPNGSISRWIEDSGEIPGSANSWENTGNP
jgi:hypothetical protein